MYVIGTSIQNISTVGRLLSTVNNRPYYITPTSAGGPRECLSLCNTLAVSSGQEITAAANISNREFSNDYFMFAITPFGIIGKVRNPATNSSIFYSENSSADAFFADKTDRYIEDENGYINTRAMLKIRAPTSCYIAPLMLKRSNGISTFSDSTYVGMPIYDSLVAAQVVTVPSCGFPPYIPNSYPAVNSGSMDCVYIAPTSIKWGKERTGATHTTIAGRRFSYVWGSRDVVEILLDDVPKSDADYINGLWANGDIAFIQNTDKPIAEISSGRITNASKPIGTRQMTGNTAPYQNKGGIIVLESF